jgi:hypothetical protein
LNKVDTSAAAAAAQFRSYVDEFTPSGLRARCRQKKKGEIFKLLLPPLSFDAPLFYYCAPIYIWIYILYTSRNSGEFEMVQQCMVGKECLLPMKLNRPYIDWYMAYKCRNNIRVSHHLKRGCHATHTHTYEELLGNKITQKLLPGEKQ